MDTGEVYLRMCNCPEIQEKWFAGVGDYATNKAFPDTAVLLTEKYFDEYGQRLKLGKKNFSWIPRQDQLQDMIVFEGEKPPLIYLMMDFEKFCHSPMYSNNKVSQPPTVFKSYEQVWLAFYMAAMHKKIWDTNKNEWVEAA